MQIVFQISYKCWWVDPHFTEVFQKVISGPWATSEQEIVDLILMELWLALLLNVIERVKQETSDERKLDQSSGGEKNSVGISVAFDEAAVLNTLKL